MNAASPSPLYGLTPALVFGACCHYALEMSLCVLLAATAKELRSAELCRGMELLLCFRSTTLTPPSLRPLSVSLEPSLHAAP